MPHFNLPLLPLLSSQSHSLPPRHYHHRLQHPPLPPPPPPLHSPYLTFPQPVPSPAPALGAQRLCSCGRHARTSTDTGTWTRTAGRLPTHARRRTPSTACSDWIPPTTKACRLIQMRMGKRVMLILLPLMLMANLHLLLLVLVVVLVDSILRRIQRDSTLMHIEHSSNLPPPPPLPLPLPPPSLPLSHSHLQQAIAPSSTYTTADTRL